MPELNDLSGVQRRIVVHGAEAAVAVVHQASVYVLPRGIVEGKLQLAFDGMAALGAPVGGGQGR